MGRSRSSRRDPGMLTRSGATPRASSSSSLRPLVFDSIDPPRDGRTITRAASHLMACTCMANTQMSWSAYLYLSRLA
eukprot:7310812-Pyramimonas_sp.AAC.1